MIREVVHKPVKKQPWKSSLGYMPTMDDFFAQLENDPLFITPLADGLGRQVDELKSSSGWNAQRGEFLAKEKEIADWSTEVEVSQREEAAKMEIERIAEEERLAAEAKAEQERQNVLKRAAEEQELAEQQAREEEARSQTEAAQVKLIGTLSPEWEDKVNRAMETRSMAAEVAKSMGIGLTRKDLGTVLPQSSADGVGWLNDEVVNGFLSAAVARGLEKDGYVRGAGRVPPYHAFNTNFYNNIRDKGPESVLRWTVRAKISLKSVLQTSKVFVPINDHSHWTLLVVSAQDKTIEYLDSLGGSGARYIRAVRSWLRAELGEEYVQEEWAELRTVSARQNNALDCGVFVCFNTLAAMRGLSPETAFQAEDMPRARRMVAAVLLNGGFSGPFEF
ncbi:hypothetical protein B0A49_07776 [Cryomyces minteri]|uniref:Ubiquitin-like protease family profile domain-containing protein n=1 Tax=Cryomyces minteri TaxID=331657 RepID=A0A4U0WEV1_9PEZI|nr:hypothetical protein B0A49_07776 [Cryomyces minteri]